MEVEGHGKCETREKDRPKSGCLEVKEQYVNSDKKWG